MVSFGDHLSSFSAIKDMVFLYCFIRGDNCAPVNYFVSNTFFDSV